MASRAVGLPLRRPVALRLLSPEGVKAWEKRAPDYGGRDPKAGPEARFAPFVH